MTEQSPTTETPKKTGKIILWVVLLVIAVAIAFLTSRVVKDIVTTWEFTKIDGFALVDPTATPEPGEASASEGNPSEAEEPSSSAPPAPAGPRAVAYFSLQRRNNPHPCSCRLRSYCAAVH